MRRDSEDESIHAGLFRPSVQYLYKYSGVMYRLATRFPEWCVARSNAGDPLDSSVSLSAPRGMLVAPRW